MSKCTICDKRKLAIFEAWSMIDYVMFNGKSPSKVLSKKSLNEYNVKKGSFLINLYEIYKATDYISENTYKDRNDLVSKSIDSAKNIYNESIKLIKSDKVKLMLKEELNSKPNVNVRCAVKEHVLRTAIDKICLESALKEFEGNLLESTQGELLIGAHKGFRDSMINITLKGCK